MRVESHLHIARARRGDKNMISYRPAVDGGKTDYASTLALRDVTFAVQPAGLRKFREKGQKNVHAYVRGTVVFAHTDIIPANIAEGWRVARYNPMRNDSFIDAETGQTVTTASEAILVGPSVYYKP